MRRYLRSVAGAMVAMAVGAGVAYADSTATPEQMLCSSHYIFVGRVLSAVNEDCRLKASSKHSCSLTSPRNEVLLKIVVTGIYGVRSDLPAKPGNMLRVGQTIDPMTRTRVFPFNKEKFAHQGGLAFAAPYDAVLPDDWIRAAYVDQEFIFSGSPSWVLAWSPEKKAWALETMRRWTGSGSGACPEPL